MKKVAVIPLEAVRVEVFVFVPEAVGQVARYPGERALTVIEVFGLPSVLLKV